MNHKKTYENYSEIKVLYQIQNKILKKKYFFVTFSFYAVFLSIERQETISLCYKKLPTLLLAPVFLRAGAFFCFFASFLFKISAIFTNSDHSILQINFYRYFFVIFFLFFYKICSKLLFIQKRRLFNPKYCAVYNI